MDHFKDGIRKYATFTGRATRTQYWMFVLATFVLSIAIGFLGGLLAVITRVSYFTYLSSVFTLFVFVPSIAIGARRLHDTSRSGWWLLLDLIPVIGWIWVFVLMCLDSTSGSNEYGPNMKGIELSVPAPTVEQTASSAPITSSPVNEGTPVEAPKAAEPTEPPTLTPGATLN